MIPLKAWIKPLAESGTTSTSGLSLGKTVEAAWFLRWNFETSPVSTQLSSLLSTQKSIHSLLPMTTIRSERDQLRAIYMMTLTIPQLMNSETDFEYHSKLSHFHQLMTSG